MGTIEDYPRFQQSFYNMIHIQPSPIFQKVLAMDKLITDLETVRMLAGLGTTPGDYVSRIERLEQTYGGPNRLRNHHLRVLRNLDGNIDDDLNNLRTYAYAIDNYLKNSTENETDNLVLLHMMKGRMSTALRVEYNAFIQRERVADDNGSVSLFLRNKLTSEIEAREEENALLGNKGNDVKKATGKRADKKKQATAQQHWMYESASETDTDLYANEPVHHLTNGVVTKQEKPRDPAPKQPQRQRTPCLACGNDQHYIMGCETFYLMTPTERRQLVAERGACYICMATSHRSKDCPKRDTRKCTICRGRHHLLLHPARAAAHQAVDYDAEDSNDSEIDNNQVSCAYQQTRKPKRKEGLPALDTVITYLTVWLTNPATGKTIKANLLADTGANSCSLDTDLGRKLGLQGQAQPYHVQVGGGRINTYAAFGTQVLIQGVHDGSEKFEIKVHVYDTPCGSLGAVNWAERKQAWPHLAELELPVAADGNVDGIIGMSEPTLIAALAPAVAGGRREPVATKTKLGWMVGGPTNVNAEQSNMAVTFMGDRPPEDSASGTDYDQLRKALQRFWAPEGLGNDSFLRQPATTTRLEKRATAIFHKTLSRLQNGQYQVGLLWRNGFFVPHNETEALRMFRKLEAQMESNKVMRDNFNATIADWLNKQIATYVMPSDIQYYLPTFMVVRTDKPTTAYRLVVDGSRKFRGICLNDRLLPGPSMINHVFDVLCKMRMGRHAFTCDVQMMYLNVKVTPDDRKFLGMFFRATSNDPIRVIQLSSHPFGLTSSPYVAMGVVQHHANLRQKCYPLAKEAVDCNVIVDDFIVSGDEVPRLQQTLEQLEAFLTEIGMGIHKVATSHRAIVQNIEEAKIAKTMNIGRDQEASQPPCSPTVKTLGLVWITETDTVHVDFKPIYYNDPLTLRKVVSDGGRLFDPLGLVLPVAMAGRILQQACWGENKGWDSVLPTNLQQRWRRWVKNTLNISSYKVPRTIKRIDEPIEKQRLIIFVDASSEAQAATVYVQTLHCNGRLEARLLCAKGKVSSIRRQESIPRLECAAAAMGAEFGSKVATVIGIDKQTSLYFSDSMTTLWWIKSEKPLKVYVANRVCAILDATSRKQWFHVKTDENPADLPTRTTSVKTLAKSELWNFGPEFLSRPEREWDQQPGIDTTTEAAEEAKDIEAALDKLHITKLMNYDALGKWLRAIWGKYSSPTKGFNITAYVHHAYSRFYRRLKGHSTNSGNDTTTRVELADLRENCLTTLLRQEQQRFLHELRTDLEKQRPIKTRWACWRPFLDAEGLIRINGRLSTEQTLPYDQRHPVFLTKGMPMALELAKLWHEERLRHTGGPQHLITCLRTRFWIENGTVVAKRAIRQCSQCQVHKMREVPYQTGPLHTSRFDAIRPFSHLGVDMFGPMEIKRGRGRQREKRYGIIFTCCFTRAINVEVATDASAYTCMLAFKRHAATYGQPVEINSDRGTNFILVRSTIQDIQTAWEDCEPLIRQEYPEIKWQLNPPRTPSFGGHFEALVKTIKQTFKTLVRWPKYLLTEEELITGLKEAAGMANMRPITPLSEDPNDLPPLRPSDFLNAPTLNLIPNWNDRVLVHTLKTELDKLKQEVWERMRAEVLSHSQRLKDIHQSKIITVGEIVLLRNHDWRPEHWPLARILQVHPGKDGIVRVATVRYATKTDGKLLMKESVQSVKNLFRIAVFDAISDQRLQ